MFSYEELLSENEKLKRENAYLKNELNKYIKPIKETAVKTSGFSDCTVNKFSTPQQKIDLFKTLFIGRKDVFAKRWFSKTTEKSGYQPVCGNEWGDMLCDKKKYKCSTCPNRKLIPLTDKDLFNHLAGKDKHCRDVVGIYPMLDDDTCLFCCVDFDDDGYEEASKVFCSVCIEYNVPAYIERSRSGNGAHIWIFFSSPVPAKTARSLASGILTHVMERCSKVSFKSYDRMFPNQDTVPKGGFGNLIALPLQGMARKNGNSVFVNEDFIPYEDQWAYLSTMKKLDKEFAEAIIGRLCRKNELGELMTESEEKPWKSDLKAVSPFDFPQEIEVAVSNMIYVPTAELNSRAINAIKRLAAFKNPDFYRTQAMRMPVYNKPRIICLAENFDKYLAIPRGCKNALFDLFGKNNVNYHFQDETYCGKEIAVSFNGELREEQKPAAEVLLNDNIGVLSATTAFGKTVIASYIISQRKTNTLILVHTQSLMNQWKEALEKFLDLKCENSERKSKGRKTDNSPFGTLGAGKNALHGNVDVAIMQSLIDDGEVKELVRNYGMIIVDECHHVSAVNFEAILKYANAKYVYGLTATPTRQDGQHPIVFMECGDIRYMVDAREQAKKRDFEHYLIPKFTSFRKSYENGTVISQIYSDLAESELRNGEIADDVINSVSIGRTPIVLTERKEHAVKLKKLIEGKCKNVILLTGAASQKEKRLTMENLNGIPDSETLVVIATGKYVGEGFDYPRFDTLFLALPIAWKGKVAQYAGRLHRNYPGKKEVQIYDYADIHIPVLERMYQKRLKGYSSIGYKIKVENDLFNKPSIIYDGKSFVPVFLSDIKDAQKEVVIVSPFIRMHRLKSLQSTLCEAVRNGIKITAVTRPPDDFTGDNKVTAEECIEMLKSLGIAVQTKSNIHQKFTILDAKTIWYGSVNFLSYGNAEESLMRFDSYDIAGELLDTVFVEKAEKM